MSISAGTIHRVDRAYVQQWLPLLDAWLLHGAIYGVQHTWPQLYRNDGAGSFFVMLDEDRLLSHCACRIEQLHDGDEVTTIGLVGSVATSPEVRGLGFAGHVLSAAVESLAEQTDTMLLWAERPELYARQGFGATGYDRCLLLIRRPFRSDSVIRQLEIPDHETLHALHERKPRRISRSLRTMSTLLTTPGMTTVVLEREGKVVAYACTGKGADLVGHWHEMGGTDEDLAELIPAAMHITGQIEAALLLPPYRSELAERLAMHIAEEVSVPGPMMRPAPDPSMSCWIDGLDSV